MSSASTVMFPIPGRLPIRRGAQRSRPHSTIWASSRECRSPVRRSIGFSSDHAPMAGSAICGLPLRSRGAARLRLAFAPGSCRAPRLSSVMRRPKASTSCLSMPASSGVSRDVRCVWRRTEKPSLRASARSRPPTVILSAARDRARGLIWRARPRRRGRQYPAPLPTRGRGSADMAKPFTKLSTIAAPLMRSNIDTDVIIRIERLVGNAIRGTLGKWAFGSLRYLADGSENPDFILNREPYRQAEILVTGPNFGCGSSREGAVWALQEMGIRAIIGSGFGDIFFANCFQNGILPIIVDKEIVDGLAADVESTQGAGRIAIDLEAQTITSPSGKTHRFEIDPRRRDGLLEGLDEVAQTLRRDDEIRTFQAADAAERPWIHFTGKQV